MDAFAAAHQMIIVSRLVAWKAIDGVDVQAIIFKADAVLLKHSGQQPPTSAVPVRILTVVRFTWEAANVEDALFEATLRASAGV